MALGVANNRVAMTDGGSGSFSSRTIVEPYFDSFRGIQIYLKIGDTEYSVPYGNLVSLKNDRIAKNKGNSFNLVLAGDMSLDIEKQILLSQNKKIQITYGWADEPLRTFTGYILGLSTKFENRMAAVSVNGIVDVGFGDTKTAKRIFQSGTTLGKIMSLMYGAHPEWSKGGVVADAYPLRYSVVQEDITDSEFLAQVLGKRLISKKDMLSDYVLWFTNEGNRSVLNYAPLSWMGKDTTREYSYNNGTNSALLSFEWDFDGTVAYQIGDSVVSEFINPNTGDMVRIQNDSDTVLAAGAIRGVAPYLAQKKLTILAPDSAKADTLVRAYKSQAAAVITTARAKLLGDVYLDMGDYMKIAVYLNDGSLHYSSGTYMATSVSDEINSSGFVTSVELTKAPSSDDNVKQASTGGGAGHQGGR